jgi:hypothetical protein
LSHLKIYELALKNHKDDDLILGLEDKLKNAIQSAPKDWDMLLLSYLDHGSTELPDNKHYRKIQKFYLTNCYLITVKGIKKLLKDHKLIYNQIDSYLSDLAKNNVMNIYCHKEKLSRQVGGHTNIQIYGVK